MFLLRKSGRTLTEFPASMNWAEIWHHSVVGASLHTRGYAAFVVPRLTGAPQVWLHGGAAKGQTLPNVNGAQQTSGGTAERPVAGAALTEALSLFSLQVCWWLRGFDSGCHSKTFVFKLLGAFLAFESSFFWQL